MAKRAVAKKSEGIQIVDQVPEHLREHAGEGIETLGSDAFGVPLIKLMQALSPELEDHDDMKQGHYLNTVTQTNLGVEFLIVPVWVSQSAMLWRPRKDGGGILARADDGINWDQPNTEFDVKVDGRSVTWNTGKNVPASGLLNFGSEAPGSKRPAATRYINVVCYLPEHPDSPPAILPFSRTGYKAGTKLNQQLAGGGAPSWGRVFQISSKKESGAEGDYYVPTVKAMGFVNDEATTRVTKAMYEQFKSMDVVKANISEGDQETDSSSGQSTHGDY